MSSGAGTAKEINVTPLIDVLLVLLIIFLVSMPILMRMQTVELPPQEPDSAPAKPPVVLKLHADLTVSIDGGSPVLYSDLPAQLRQRADATSTVFIDVDDALPWNDAIGLVDTVARSTDGARTAIRMRTAGDE